MDSAFSHLLSLLSDIPDPRRAQGKLYKLPHIFLFSILAVMAGANSYRAVHSFIDVHLARLKRTFGLGWTRAPAYTTLRGILQGLDAIFLPTCGISDSLHVTSVEQPWGLSQGCSMLII